MIKVIIPTRGMVRGKTIQSVLRETKGVESDIEIVDQLPLPDCFNVPIKNSINSLGLTHFLIVEDDVEIPEGGLQKMLRLNSDVACIDYPLETGFGCVAWHKGRILWCGTGCILIKVYVLSEIGYPWFRSDLTLNRDDTGYHIDKSPPNKYGGHDIIFGLKVNMLGFKIKAVYNTIAKHHKVIKYPDKAVNGSVYEFSVFNKIKKTVSLNENPIEYLDKTQFTIV